jgi:hypothetical protein
MTKSCQTGEAPTYDEQDRSPINEVAFKAIFRDPAGGMNIQGSKDLVHIL